MVDARYMLEKRPRPAALKVKLDQFLVPALIDAAGVVEGQLERTAGVTRKAPLAAVGAAFGVGYVLATLYTEGAARRRPRMRS